jgi:hypothetical protein
MNTTILNYPGFQSLPKGARQMLLVSEAHFFEESATHAAEQSAGAQEVIARRGLRVILTSLLVTMSAVLKWQ